MDAVTDNDIPAAVSRPESGTSLEDIRLRWEAIYGRQSERTRLMIDCLMREGWAVTSLGYKCHLNETLPQALSRFFIKNFSDRGLYQREAERPPVEVLRDYLVSAFETVLACQMINPHGPEGRIAKAILGKKSGTEWGPAYINDDGKIVFLESSVLEIRDNNNRIEIHIDRATPFVQNVALKDGFRKSLCAVNHVKCAESYMRLEGFYLADREPAIVNVIENLHQSDNGIFATGEKIAAFNFRENVLSFVSEASPVSARRLM